MPTWSDYTESTQVSPSYQNGYGYADLVAYHNIHIHSVINIITTIHLVKVCDEARYYVTWFKTGSPPAIVKEAIYYTHRNQKTDAPYLFIFKV